MVIHLEKEERQRLQLFRAKYTQVVRASQDEQGGDIEEAAKGLDDATGEAQERRNQRDAPAGRLKQIIKESCDSDLAGHFDQVDRETQLKKALCVSMLVAVAAASPSTTSLPLTKPWANIPVSMVRRYNTPVILALRRGDVSVIAAVPMFVLRYAKN